MNPHQGHRERKKRQFRDFGLDAFADHEALELLLYYAIPRQDTNPLAHELLRRFGSLERIVPCFCVWFHSFTVGRLPDPGVKP